MTMTQDITGLLGALPAALLGMAAAIAALGAVWGVIVWASRAVSGGAQGKRAAYAVSAAPAQAEEALPPAPEPVVLEGIGALQAACVMAIVSHETGIPLEQLTFKSIRAV